MDFEIEDGQCPNCGTKAELRTCDQCGTSAWIIDCGHYAQPRPIAAGRSDGSEMHHTFCDDCAEAVVTMEPTNAVHCDCGRWSGVRCAWSGPVEDTVVVEWMPQHLRASHEAAGNRGAASRNGAERIRVNRECAEWMIDTDGEWCSIIEECVDAS